MATLAEKTSYDAENGIDKEQGTTVITRGESDPADPEVKANEDLHRGLKARQITMIALGGAIGTGLVIGSGTGLSRGGPVGLLLGYIIMGAVCFSVMVSLGEMATYLPHKKGFSGYATRFVDPAMGFAVGYNYLCKYLIVTPNNIVAGSIIVQYWTQAVPVGAWITIFLVIIIAINMLGIRAFGEIEFWASLFKVVVLSGLILVGLIIDLGGVPGQERIGFRYWKQSPFSSYLVDGNTGVFLGVWAVMVNALFAYMGSELVGVTFGEAKNPRKVVPATIKRTFWRLLIFYVGSVFVVGLIVKADDPDLLAATKRSTSAAASPFVLAIQRANIRVLPDIINASILLFVMSAANSDLYIGSRTLYALAAEGKAPRIFMRTNKLGVPYVAEILCAAFCCLAYLTVSSGSKQVFTYFVALVTIFGALTWMSILYSHIRMMSAMKVQGIPRDSLPFKSWGQPYVAWTGFVITGIVTLFKGFDAFVPVFNHKTFITSYFGLPVYIILWVGYKVYYKTKWIPLAEVDLISGRREWDENEAMEEEKALAKGKQPLWRRIWEMS